MQIAPPTSPIDSLRERWTQFQQEFPKVRIRDAATRLGVSEAELLVTDCGNTVTRLDCDSQQLLKAVPTWGRVMALTRNGDCVHERKGIYSDPGFFGPIMGQVAGADIDLRMFLNHWQHIFAVSNNDSPRSIQIFDSEGNAIHKIFLQEESDEAVFSIFIDSTTSADQTPIIETKSIPPAKADPSDESVDLAALREGWDKLQDTHEFHGLLKKHGVGRLQALRLAGSKYVTPVVAAETAEAILNAASAKALPIMVFVGNRGCIQIHTGPVNRIIRHGDWINVMDPEFNLHLRDTAVASVWIVEKPTRDGTVTSVELFDVSGELIVQMFGARKPGNPELIGWRELVAKLPRIKA